MGQVGDLVGAQRAAAAGVLRPTEYPWLEEGAINDQLPATLEQVEQAYLPVRPVELVVLLHRHPRHPSAFGGQRITRSCCRAASHSCCDTIGGLFIARSSFDCSLFVDIFISPCFSDLGRFLLIRSSCEKLSQPMLPDRR